jgi:hypothetical protein
MRGIGVQTLPHPKGELTSKPGVSSRESGSNYLKVGKQMTADCGLAGAPTNQEVWWQPVCIVKVQPWLNRVCLSQVARLRCLSRCALKGACTVLRGGKPVRAYLSRPKRDGPLAVNPHRDLLAALRAAQLRRYIAKKCYSTCLAKTRPLC